MTDAPAAPPLLEARHISKEFVVADSLLRRMRGRPPVTLKAVDDVSLSINRGETVGLVGESGCGKSTFGRVLLRLYEPTGGEIYHNGVNILGHDARATRELRTKIQVVFQDPYSSLNPALTVRQALEEVLVVHKLCPPSERTARVDALLDMVGLSPSLASRKPHQFSGGQRQRIGIARALAVGPDFIVADEAVSALDVSVQAQVLNLFQRLQEELGLTYLFIAHNLGVVRHISRRVAVMYLGRIVELAPADDLFREPLHPYTQALLRAVPMPTPRQKTRIPALEGDPPSPVNRPSGCHFHPRCPHAMAICRDEYPAIRVVGAGRTVACHLYPEGPVAS
ncbi:MAG: dipeptide ABC transporter ATP-binding protein [Chloroflexota bacterium]